MLCSAHEPDQVFVDFMATVVFETTWQAQPFSLAESTIIYKVPSAYGSCGPFRLTTGVRRTLAVSPATKLFGYNDVLIHRTICGIEYETYEIGAIGVVLSLITRALLHYVFMCKPRVLCMSMYTRMVLTLVRLQLPLHQRASLRWSSLQRRPERTSHQARQTQPALFGLPLPDQKVLRIWLAYRRCKCNERVSLQVGDKLYGPPKTRTLPRLLR